MPNPPPIYVTGVQNISPMIELLEQIAKEQYEIAALTDNHIKVQHKTSECYGTIVKALAVRRTEFHTYKLHYSINPDNIKIKIEILEYMVTNIWNV
jgi:hypothetical protein